MWCVLEWGRVVGGGASRVGAVWCGGEWFKVVQGGAAWCKVVQGGCLLYTADAVDDVLCVVFGGLRLISLLLRRVPRLRDLRFLLFTYLSFLLVLPFF